MNYNDAIVIGIIISVVVIVMWKYLSMENKPKDKPEGFVASPFSDEADPRKNAGLLKRYKTVEDFEPVSPETLRKSIFAEPIYNYGEMVGALLALVNVYATEHCVIRFECSHKGDIAACHACFCEKILTPDMQRMAGGQVAMWPARR